MRERSIIFNTKFFIIHNLDKNRKERILSELYKAGVEDKDIIFINHPNKNEITYKIARTVNIKFNVHGLILGNRLLLSIHFFSKRIFSNRHTRFVIQFERVNVVLIQQLPGQF